MGLQILIYPYWNVNTSGAVITADFIITLFRSGGND